MNFSIAGRGVLMQDMINFTVAGDRVLAQTLQYN